MFKHDILIRQAQERSLALSLLNIELLCNQYGCAYYDYNNHGIVLFFVNPMYIVHFPYGIVGITYKMNRIASQILVLQDALYQFKKDRFGYTQKFLSQQDYINYIKQCHDYTMQCYKLDGIL